MKKFIILSLAGILVVFSFSFAFAVQPEINKIAANAAPSKVKAGTSVPAHAKEIAPGVFSLGFSADKGRLVEGYMFVNYKKNFAKSVCGNGICEPGENARKCPLDCGGGGEEPPADSDCYSFLAKGARWRALESWVFNASNTRGLDGNYVFNNLEADINKWETAADYNILGSGSKTSNILIADEISPDGVNEVYFADIADPGAIGVTVVWGIFTGPPFVRELVEWDQVYDDVSFDWSDSGAAGKMDFESIATHELGHSVGMGDLYDDPCAEQTMYGYASTGETKKRDLESGDIAGIKALY